MAAKKTVVEVHKFGGASVADGAAYRHAVTIVKGHPGAPVVVVSAPGGITDALLGLERVRLGRGVGFGGHAIVGRVAD